MKTSYTIASISAALVGAAALVLGLADVLVWAGSTGPISIGILEITGDDFFRWAWGGLVVVLGGVLMLAGARSLGDLDQRATAVLGVIMVWLIAGCDIFGMICSGIPAGEESEAFFNSLGGFIGGFAPPYAPAILLLPFTLIVAWLLLDQRQGA
ncbi:hypothetical protein RJ40_01070 [Methanofollis aquaemaris]|uniref:Uncharacterized protein n=1 Tax=Methanofollis aquaemaris TaxID=126734 RepID=A0A8A3S0P2_9EURY|nr:hypothetical protein [Methanofollis aquaemaris]QSZ66187.1 hypothetical protein RJ40_01070 [Methanofollis aquaemaris]